MHKGVSEKPMQILHFSFGPVQGFVSQARRTRDLWAGSYLLSYLAGQAMLAIEQAGGEIVFPSVRGNSVMRALRSDLIPNKHDPPDTPEGLAARIGSLPNRFMVAVPDNVGGTVAVDAIHEAWQKITNAVRTKLESKLRAGLCQMTENIWNRQVLECNVWECVWAIGDDSHALNLRKNLRTHVPAPEPGLKCTQCGERQALWDGERRPLASNPGRKETELQATRRFWQSVAQVLGGHHFRPDGGERLCAVCTVKRVFPLVGEATIGWELPHNYPSTAYLSAIGWIEKVLETAEKAPQVAAALGNFINAAETAKVQHEEAATRIKGISARLQGHREWDLLADLDGDAFFPDTIRNEKEFLPKLDADTRQKLLNALKALTEAVEAAPTPFYAILFMDGDSMGELLSMHADRRQAISNAVGAFASAVPEIVANQDGALVYAGGDDVLAFMPLETALPCARALKEVYVQAFQAEASGIAGTISAAIVYAHMNTPLQTAVRDAHRLLEQIAKDEVGRNAFAVRVWKRGGPILTLAKPWCGNGTDWQTKIDALKGSFSQGDYASGFFYRLRDLFELLDPADGDSILDDPQQVDLLAAEYMKSREREVDIETARDRVRRLRDLCREEWREEGVIRPGRVRPDGAMFLRFLEQKEV